MSTAWSIPVAAVLSCVWLSLVKAREEIRARVGIWEGVALCSFITSGGILEGGRLELSRYWGG